jgi:outer membrane protein assembly factor BamD
MMNLITKFARGAAAVVVVAGLVTASCGFHRKKYENPITKDTEQPDKKLFDQAIRNIEKSRFEQARLQLNTLINTYDASEFLAKAKLAIADSWYRQGGAEGMAQSEAEYKDFILFYPTMEEAAESQFKICEIHFKQMDKADRDPTNALRAEQECRQLIVQFPNSKFARQAEQRLRDVQEVLAQSEMAAGDFYHHKGSFSAAANRLNGLVGQYPLYSKADEALWMQADSYSHMGARFRTRAGEAYTRLVRDYPLSEYADQAKKKLQEMEMPIPDADPEAVARMKFEAANRTKPGMMSPMMDLLRRGPNVTMAAKSGIPTMDPPKREVPANVPVPADATAAGAGAGAGGAFQGDVTVAPVTGQSALDTQPDARAGGANGTATGGTDNKATDSTATTTPAAATPAATGNAKSNGKKNSKKK